MGFWDTLVQSVTGRRKENKASPAYASIYPVYEQQTPQYPAPNPYSLAQAGYRSNELIYACIGKRARAIAEAPMWVYDDSGETPEEIKDHSLRLLLRHPNERVTEKKFWQITQIFLDIAGFAAWEIERNNLGEPITLWPMRPDFCSFYRGDGRPIRAVRYQPYGLPPVNIPIENVLLYEYFDPLFPLLKGFSPTMACLRQLGVDNSTTDFLKLFMQDGAQFSGLLKTVQSLTDVEAERIQQRWQKQHGGVQNWAKVAVLGSGAEYQSTQMNMRDMTFPELDARTESRICMSFEMPPILVGAKIGMDRSTYSNYAEARRAWYEEWVSPQWEILASDTQEQMLPQYHDDADSYLCEFMTRKVKALQEDKNLTWQRSILASTSGVITRDEAREEMGFDPIDNAPVFVSSGAPEPGEETAEIPEQLMPFVSGESDTEDPYGSDAEQELEEKQFRSFAARRLKENKSAEISSFKWRFIPSWKRDILLAEVGAPQSAPFQSDEY